MSATGTKMVHVPYKGTAPALNDLLAGNIDLIFMELSSAVRLHQGGNARISRSQPTSGWLRCPTSRP